MARHKRFILLPGIRHIRTVQELIGHNDVRTTMIYTPVLNRGWRALRSPADWMTPFSEPTAPSLGTVHTLRGGLDTYIPDDGDEPPQRAITQGPRPPVAPAPVAL